VFASTYSSAVFMMRCKGTGYLRIAIVISGGIGTIRRLLAQKTIMRWRFPAPEVNGIAVRTHGPRLSRSLGQPINSLGRIALCRVAWSHAIQVGKT
jgi:hypothetical protein